MLTWITDLLKALFGAWLAKKPVVVVEAEQAGAAQAQLNTANQAAKTEAATAQAEANAPGSVEGVEDRLSKGSF